MRGEAAGFGEGDGADFCGGLFEVEDVFVAVFPFFDGANLGDVGDGGNRGGLVGGYVFYFVDHGGVDADLIPTIVANKLLLKTFLTGRNNNRIQILGVYVGAGRRSGFADVRIERDN